MTLLAMIGLASSPLAFAQRGGPDWTTSAGDPQRTSWVRQDPFVNPEKMTKPGMFKELWKVKLDGIQGKPSEAVLISTYIGYRGFKALAIVTGGGHIAAVDYDLGVPFWNKQYDASAKPACAAWPSAVGKASSLTPIPPRAQRAMAPYRTETGKPHEGISLDLAMGGQLGPGATFRPPAPAQALPPGIRFSVPIFYITSDGIAHAITFDSGKEPFKPVQLLPAGSAPSDLIVTEDTLYAAAMPGCGGAANSLYALDVTTKDMVPAGVWKSTGGNILGAPAFNKEGTLFVSTDKGLYALKKKTLESTTVGEAALTSTPVVITGKSSEWVAVGTKDSILLFDGKGTAATPVKSAVSGFTPTALATYDDKSGAHWLLATDDMAAKGSVHAFKVSDDGSLTAAWSSSELAAPGRPMIVDGIVFTLSTGADRSGDHTKPPTKGTHATIYALDAATGKPVWDSGDSITSFVDTSQLSFNESQVFLSTADNVLYSFGHPEPHQ